MYKRMKFLEEGRTKEKLTPYMNPPKNYINSEEKSVFLGYPQTIPHPIALETYKNYLEYNENHVGVFSNVFTQLDQTRKMEKELIEMLGDLYGDDTVDGYVTSGGTEGNIMGTWIGKELLGKDCCVIKSYLTHQSIDKACCLCSLSNVITISYTDEYVMDLAELESIIKSQINLGVKSFIIVATMGYTMTGSKDNIEKIDMLIQHYEMENSIKFYFHIDAAIGGLVFPFLHENEGIFKYKSVKSLTVDPHKMGYVPFSAGIFICRKSLQESIAIPIKYAKTVYDKTLISSRNGAAAATCWVMFQYLGKEGFKRELNKLIILKEYLVKKLLSKNLIEVISDQGTNMVCIHFNCIHDGILSDQLEKKYILDGFILKYRGQDYYCYKIYIMPHVTKESLDYFIEDIVRISQVNRKDN
ncbi:pyridoxal-dependent decarboxylase [Lachnotalea glycerini]|nr:pyridoxal-dependent decarboxylase [Lachnotalea glycerini]